MLTPLTPTPCQFTSAPKRGCSAGEEATATLTLLQKDFLLGRVLCHSGNRALPPVFIPISWGLAQGRTVAGITV